MKQLFNLDKLLKKFRRSKSGYKTGQLRTQQSAPRHRGYSVRKNRVARIKQWLGNRNNQTQHGFSPARKRQKHRIRTFGLIGCLVLVALFVGGGGLEKAKSKLVSLRLFQIDSMMIVGNSIVANEKIRAVSGIVVHQTSMLGIRTSELERKIAALPWVASVKVNRNWPSGVEIEVKENIPLALLAKGAPAKPQLYYIDKYGVSFLPVSPGGVVDFPVITGLSAIDELNLREQALSEALIFLQKVRRNDPHLPAHSVSEVHIKEDGKLVVYLVEYPFPIFFGNGHTKQKYGRLVQVLKALYKKEKGKNLISKIEYIQMDYLQDKVLVAQTGSG